MTQVHPPRRAALAFIFVTVLLDLLSMGLVIPVLPELVKSFSGGNTGRAAEMFGLFGTAWALMQFFFAPLLGALSDRFGRRPVILLSNFGLGIDYLFMALAPSLGWLFVGRVFSGITAATIPSGWAYVSDVTPPEKRAAAFGKLGMAFGLGFVLGPALGGLLGKSDPRLPFWVAGALSLLNACYGLWVLPESLPRERRATFNWARANPLGALKLLGSHPQLPWLAAVGFLLFLAHEVLTSTFVLYAGFRYGWTKDTVGLTLAGVGVCGAIVQGGLVRPFVRRFGERTALLWGLVFGTVGFSVYGFAETGHGFWLGVPIMSLWGLCSPALQGLMTRRVSPSEQGRLQGSQASLRGISGLIGPGLFTFTFATFLGTPEHPFVPGAAFFLAAALLAFGFVVAWRVAFVPTTEAPAVPDPSPAA